MAEPLWAVWEDLDLSNDAAMTEYDRLDALVSDIGDIYVDPGAVKDIWLIYRDTDLPDEFTRLGTNGGAGYMGGA